MRFLQTLLTCLHSSFMWRAAALRHRIGNLAAKIKSIYCTLLAWMCTEGKKPCQIDTYVRSVKGIIYITVTQIKHYHVNLGKSIVNNTSLARLAAFIGQYTALLGKIW